MIRDGKTELVAACAFGSIGTVHVTTRVGSGSGGLSAAANFAVGSSPKSVATGDFNRDGKTDLVVANQNSSTVSILFGTGNGGFGPRTDFAVGAAPTSVAVGDSSGDRKQ